ncbi:MAG: CDP-alcohol phosphatidyltransferase family protein [Lentisphaeraceae bacterium]|nr:CDP-alcohol phosphatidyltransferase family protein [Lentisphaeraceae bacterium]
MSEELNRRELKTRQSSLAQNTAKWLSSKNITPNQISIFSIFFAGAGAASLYYFQYASNQLIWILPLVTAVCIQCRLLCNLFDGMVAVEGGKGTPAGELFNDIPDRIADSLLFIAAGYAVSRFSEYAIVLGWCTALFAVATAYVRTLASAVGAPTNFCGPMAKQHRMFILTLACLLTSALNFTSINIFAIIFYALISISVGSLYTALRRARKAYKFLENQNV